MQSLQNSAEPFYKDPFTFMVNLKPKPNNQLRIRLGTNSFKKLLLESDVIVDKTLLVKSILEVPAEVLLITRPRR